MRTVLFLLASCAWAQPPAFEAATIKPSKDEIGHSGRHTRTGMMVITGQTLKALICTAYRVKPDQVAGGPKWLDGDRFDINAKAEGAADEPQMLPMLQTLLADRFQLTLHHEEKIASAYALVLGKSGLKIKPVEAPNGANSTSNGGKLTAQGISMTGLADWLARRLGSTVIDQTGAPGAYDFIVEWSTEGDASDAQSALFAALQQTLGVKLEMRKVPLDVLVIDRAEKPAEN